MGPQHNISFIKAEKVTAKIINPCFKMKSFILTFFVASFACFAEASEFSDISVFLPFLRAYEPPPACPPNELYKMCTGKCSDCTQRGMCIVTTCIKGCDCAPHFYRVTADGPCEPVAKCPKPECGENEIFRECGPVCERCTTLKCRAINCDHKCYCKEGYLRNSEGVCIPEQECPMRQHCSSTEEWAENGPKHEFCLIEGNERVNETQNLAQCYCKEGHKRNVLGYCVKDTFCSLIRCPGVEVFHDCIPKCNTTCRNYGNPNCTEDDNCYPGCFCPPGYVMNDFRACIKADACSSETSQVKIVDSSLIVEDEETTTQTSSGENSEATYTTECEDSAEAAEDSPKDVSSAGTESSSNKSDSNTTENPDSSTAANEKPPKKKIVKFRSSKHANVAGSSKQVSKLETLDEEDFDNEEI